MRFKVIYDKSAQTVTIQDKDGEISVWNEIVFDDPAQVQIQLDVDIEQEFDLPEEAG